MKKGIYVLLLISNDGIKVYDEKETVSLSAFLDMIICFSFQGNQKERIKMNFIKGLARSKADQSQVEID